MRTPNAVNNAGDDLAIDVLARFGEVRLRVTGTSMLPSMWPGDVVTIRRCAPRDVDAGQIVLVRREGRLVVHRVMVRRKRDVLTQGDALARQDPPATDRQLLGRVVSIVRDGNRIELPAFTLARRIVAAAIRRSGYATRLLLTAESLRRRMTSPAGRRCLRSGRTSNPRALAPDEPQTLSGVETHQKISVSRGFRGSWQRLSPPLDLCPEDRTASVLQSR